MTMETISSVNNIVKVDKQCYNATELQKWLATNPTLPHNRKSFTPKDLNECVAGPPRMVRRRPPAAVPLQPMHLTHFTRFLSGDIVRLVYSDDPTEAHLIQSGRAPFGRVMYMERNGKAKVEFEREFEPRSVLPIFMELIETTDGFSLTHVPRHTTRTWTMRWIKELNRRTGGDLRTRLNAGGNTDALRALAFLVQGGL